jgi:hypothetical protein
MAIKYQHVFITRLSKIYPNWIFGMKIYHLATLPLSSNSENTFPKKMEFIYG